MRAHVAAHYLLEIDTPWYPPGGMAVQRRLLGVGTDCTTAASGDVLSRMHEVLPQDLWWQWILCNNGEQSSEQSSSEYRVEMKRNGQ